jgi:hypothetical protein
LACNSSKSYFERKIGPLDFDFELHGRKMLRASHLDIGMSSYKVLSIYMAEILGLKIRQKNPEDWLCQAKIITFSGLVQKGRKLGLHSNVDSR